MKKEEERRRRQRGRRRRKKKKEEERRQRRTRTKEKEDEGERRRRRKKTKKTKKMKKTKKTKKKRKKEGSQQQKGPTLCTSWVHWPPRALCSRQTGACGSVLRPWQGMGQSSQSKDVSIAGLRTGAWVCTGETHLRLTEMQTAITKTSTEKDGHDSTVFKEGGGRDFPHETVFHSSSLLSSSLATLLTEKSILCLLFS